MINFFYSLIFLLLSISSYIYLSSREYGDYAGLLPMMSIFFGTFLVYDNYMSDFYPIEYQKEIERINHEKEKEKERILRVIKYNEETQFLHKIARCYLEPEKCEI